MRRDNGKVSGIVAKQTDITDLPKDLVKYLATFIPAASLGNLAQTSKYMNALVKQAIEKMASDPRTLFTILLNMQAKHVPLFIAQYPLIVKAMESRINDKDDHLAYACWAMLTSNIHQLDVDRLQAAMKKIPRELCGLKKTKEMEERSQYREVEVPDVNRIYTNINFIIAVLENGISNKDDSFRTCSSNKINDWGNHGGIYINLQGLKLDECYLINGECGLWNIDGAHIGKLVTSPIMLSSFLHDKASINECKMDKKSCTRDINLLLGEGLGYFIRDDKTMLETLKVWLDKCSELKIKKSEIIEPLLNLIRSARQGSLGKSGIIMHNQRRLMVLEMVKKHPYIFTHTEPDKYGLKQRLFNTHSVNEINKVIVSVKADIRQKEREEKEDDIRQKEREEKAMRKK